MLKFLFATIGVFLAAIFIAPAVAQTPAKATGNLTYSGSAATHGSKLPKAASEQPGSLPSQVDALAHQLLEKQQIPGMTLAIVRNGEIILSRAYGSADLENGVAANSAGEFRTASIAKPITAIAAMKLVEQGKLDLDAPVQQYCPAFPPKSSPDGKPWVVTTRELLAHRAGLRWYKDDNEANNSRHFASIGDAVKHFGDEPLLFEPGSKMQYTTYGYVVVGCAIEGATHQNYLEFVRETVFAPAGMEATFPDDPRRIVPHRVHGYEHAGDKAHPGALQNAPFFDPSDRLPGGGFLSTAEDLTRFASVVMAERLVSRQTLQLMWTPLSTRDQEPGASRPPSSYGLGWGIGTLEGHRLVGHNGGQAGTSTTMKLIPDAHLAVAAMTNLEGADLDDFAESILKLYLGGKK